jgi:hypothetical protein
MFVIPNFAPTALTSSAVTLSGSRPCSEFNKLFGAAVNRFLSATDTPYAAPPPTTAVSATFAPERTFAGKAPPTAFPNPAPSATSAPYAPNLAGVGNAAICFSTASNSRSNANGLARSYVSDAQHHRQSPIASRRSRFPRALGHSIHTGFRRASLDDVPSAVPARSPARARARVAPPFDVVNLFSSFHLAHHPIAPSCASTSSRASPSSSRVARGIDAWIRVTPIDRPMSRARRVRVRCVGREFVRRVVE